jgi:pilus assembly protein Flp/PilA
VVLPPISKRVVSVRANGLTLKPNLRSKNMIKNFLRDETGLELSEYAVAAALIALAVVGVFTTLGGKINTVIGNLANKIN